mgnify:CR=1 FL=1
MPLRAIGCWETEAGEVALLRHAGLTEGDRACRQKSPSEAAVGDGPTLRAIAEVGRWLGFGIGNLISIFNPDLVILGGLYQRLFRTSRPSVIEGAGLRTLASVRKLATIARSSLGPDAPLIGAAELVLSDVIADPAGTNGRSAVR